MTRKEPNLPIRRRCKCGGPLRKGQRTCKKCHAEAMRKFRAERVVVKPQKLTKKQVDALVAMAAAGALERLKSGEATEEDAQLLENCLNHLHAGHK